MHHGREERFRSDDFSVGPGGVTKAGRYAAFLPGAILFITVLLSPPPETSPGLHPGSLVYSRDGEILRVFLNEAEQWLLPWPSALSEVPRKLEQAVLFSEDRYFIWHPGINPGAIARAAVQNIRSNTIVSGASTITMQLARILDPKPRTLISKMVEVLQALRLELRFTKREILSRYLSLAPYGGNVIGAPAAALRYYGKRIDELTWAEAATIAVLPRSPSRVFPGEGDPSLELRAARDRLIDALYRDGLINEQTRNRGLAEDIPEGPIPFPFDAPHFGELVVRGAGLAGPGPAGPDPAGREIHTFIDLDLQLETERIASIHSEYLRTLGIDNLSILVARTQNGEIAAYVGSQGYFDVDRNGFVDGVVAPRSSGSILKPFLYGLAIDEGIIAPDTMIIDIPTHFGAFFPRNVGLIHYGMLPAREALAHSLNVPAVRILDEYGVADFHFALEGAGISTLFRSPADYGLTLIIGGAETSLIDLVALYRVFGNEGVFAPLRLHDSTVRSPPTTERRVLSEGSAFLVLDMLKDLRRPGDESWWRRRSDSAALAWKTGTSFGNRDAWAVGVSPEWTIGVWVGNFTGEENANLTSTATSAPLLFDVWSLVSRDAEWFDPPVTALRELEFCLDTGYPAGDACENSGPAKIPVGAKMLPICPYHRRVHLDENGHEVNSLCWEGHEVRIESRLYYPAEAVQYLVGRGAAIEQPPQLNLDCPDLASVATYSSPSDVLSILYPRAGARLYLPRDLDGELQAVNLKAAHRSPDTRIFWYIDGIYLGQTATDHAIASTISPGEHTLLIVDERGEKSSTNFRVWSGDEEN